MQAVKKILVVTADPCHAQFYMAHGPHELRKLAYFEHPAGHLHESQLTSKEHDVDTCPYEGHIKKEHEVLVFAKFLAEHIESYLRAEQINEVCVFAPIKFLDHIKQQKFAKLVKITGVGKDYIHQGMDATHLQEAMRTAGLSFVPKD